MRERIRAQLTPDQLAKAEEEVKKWRDDKSSDAD